MVVGLSESEHENDRIDSAKLCKNPIKAISYAGYRSPQQVISYAVWLYFRFPLSLRMVEEILAQRGIKYL